MNHGQNHFIEVNQLRVGLYVHLDLGWMDHPFPLNNFKVKDDEQIAKIRKTGLRMLRYDPARSDCEPLSKARWNEASTPTVEAEIAKIETAEDIAASEAAEKKSLRKKKLHQLHQAMDLGERKFIKAANTVKQLTKNVMQHPQATIQEAEIMVNQMVDCVLNQSEIALHAINGTQSDDAQYQHPLNVTVLSLLLAKSVSISEEDARMLGMAAIFHDIGKQKVPEKILLKKEELTKAEQTIYEQHCEFGAEIAKQVGMTPRTASVILQHHELADGSGYPKRLKLEQIDQLASIISLVSQYDELCNPINYLQAKTPYEALAYLFSHKRSKFDEALLKRMIKSLGIYPPGSIVQLSNGQHAIVVSTNPNQPLRPFVLLHDAKTPRDNPELLDLREEVSLNISICLKPSQLPTDVMQYLNPRKRISYFVDKDYAESSA